MNKEKFENFIYDASLIKELFIRMLIVTVIGMFFTLMCVTIDSILTGQFLGKDAVAAIGILQPVTGFCGLTYAILGPGTSMLCSRYIGKADTVTMNRVFSTSVTVEFAVCLMLTIILFNFASPIAQFLTSSDNNAAEVTQLAADYLRGYAMCIVPTGLTAVISGLMMVDNDIKTAFLSMGCITS